MVTSTNSAKGAGACPACAHEPALAADVVETHAAVRRRFGRSSVTLRVDPYRVTARQAALAPWPRHAPAPT